MNKSSDSITKLDFRQKTRIDSKLNFQDFNTKAVKSVFQKANYMSLNKLQLKIIL